jgi:hypothetical protein
MRQGSIATAESPGMVHDAALMHPTRMRLTALGSINMPQFFRQQVGWAEKPSMMLDEDAGLFSPAYFTDRVWRLMAKSLEQALRRLRLAHLFW